MQYSSEKMSRDRGHERAEASGVRMVQTLPTMKRRLQDPVRAARAAGRWRTLAGMWTKR
jgi:hypothetical protein